MKTIKPRKLKGFRDFLPKQIILREKILGIMQKIFKSFGFSPIETPALEYSEILLGKYGAEANKLIYRFKDRGKRDIALRYDLTVPLARLFAENEFLLEKPFKRYQIQRVWRAENPQRARYREFTQCDIDIISANSALADAEIIAILYFVFKKLKFKQFTILINSREILFSVIQKAGITSSSQIFSIIRTLDKLEKVSFKEVERELALKKVSPKQSRKIFNFLEKAKPDSFLEEVLHFAKNLGVEEKFLKFSPSLARGLDYYTGPIYEVVVKKPKIGSIAGGGRYDNLIQTFLNKKIPSCGASFGIERIIEIVQELNLFGQTQKTFSQVLIAIFDKKFLKKAAAIAHKLRKENINTEIYLNIPAKIDKQLKYADKKGIPFVVILGPNEIKKHSLIIKNLKTRKQKEIKEKHLISELETLL